MDTLAILENIPPQSENSITDVDGNQLQKQWTIKEVSHHSSYDSCWIFIGNCVYDVTEYLSKHPGGVEIILEFAGSDATSGFLGKGHSKIAFAALEKYFIGELIPKDRLYPILSRDNKELITADSAVPGSVLST